LYPTAGRLASGATAVPPGSATGRNANGGRAAAVGRLAAAVEAEYDRAGAVGGELQHCVLEDAARQRLRIGVVRPGV
jgi:hypothetical protein